MNCQEAQDLLYAADRVDRPTEPLGAHLADCEPCRILQSKLIRLEQATRELPVPKGADEALAAFQESRTSRMRILHIRPWQWAAAAMMLIASATALWVWQANRAGETDSIERLVAWNLDLADQPLPADRQRTYAADSAVYRQYAQRSSKDDQELAQTLLADSAWLAKNADPLAEADHFTTVATRLLDRMDRAADGGNLSSLRKLSRSYCTVLERGVHSRLDKLDEAKLRDPQRKAKLNKILAEKDRQSQRLEHVLRRCPKPAKTEVGQALDASKKKPKQKMNRNPAGGVK